LPARNGRRRIGLCWHGGIPDAHPRSVPPLALAPLLALPGVEWVGFQLADHAGELPILGLDALGARDFVGHGGRRAAARPRRHGGHGGGSPRGEPRRADVGAAGAERVHHRCVEAPRYWTEGGATTPVYPSARLFRQDAPGDWAPVVARVVEALAAGSNRP